MATAYPEIELGLLGPRIKQAMGWLLLSQNTLRDTFMAMLLTSAVASACSCLQSPHCPGLGRAASPVFLGTVIEVTDLPPTDGFDFLNSRKARIRVTESFGGLAPTVSEIDVFTGRGDGDCGIAFKAGDSYLVSASFSNDGRLHAGICGNTRRIDRVGSVLRLLRDRRNGRTVPSLIGQIAQHDRNFNGRIGSHDPKPLPNTLVRLKSEDGGLYETMADADGIYAFDRLPGGRYQFSPDLLPGTVLSWYIGSERPLIPFELPSSGCWEHNIEVYASGSIQGRVLDSSGHPIREASVYIIPASTNPLPKWQDLYRESQGKEDYFKFVHIPPGEYLVVVNPDDSQRAEFPYRRTFHPGVHNRSEASVITVRAGEQIKDADVRLVKQFEPRNIRIRTSWANGEIIQSFVFVEAKGTANPKLVSSASTDAGKPIGNLKILPNEAYEIQATLICRYADARSVGPGATLMSPKVYLKPGDPQTELTLTIPATACPAIAGKTLEIEQ